jgi:hypothetical protein
MFVRRTCDLFQRQIVGIGCSERDGPGVLTELLRALLLYAGDGGGEGETERSGVARDEIDGGSEGDGFD